MRIAVAGATGNIGTRTVAALERAGHEVVRISRSRGVDGLEAALAGVDAVVDATSYETAGRDDAAGILAEIATGTPRGRYRDVAGPEPQDLVDMARRTNDARGHPVKLVPAWSPALGPEMAGDVLLTRRGRPHSVNHLRRVARKSRTVSVPESGVFPVCESGAFPVCESGAFPVCESGAFPVCHGFRM